MSIEALRNQVTKYLVKYREQSESCFQSMFEAALIAADANAIADRLPREILALANQLPLDHSVAFRFRSELDALLRHNDIEPDEDPALTDAAIDTLIQMLDDEVTVDSPQRQKDIERKTGWDSRRAWDSLRAAKYTASKRGVGTWLTPAGQKRARRCKDQQ